MIGERERLAVAIIRANHACGDCGEPLRGPVFDDGEWAPDSAHLRTCPALAPGSESMKVAGLDVARALRGAGLANVGEVVPSFAVRMVA